MLESGIVFGKLTEQDPSIDSRMVNSIDQRVSELLDSSNTIEKNRFYTDDLDRAELIQHFFNAKCERLKLLKNDILNSKSSFDENKGLSENVIEELLEYYDNFSFECPSETGSAAQSLTSVVEKFINKTHGEILDEAKKINENDADQHAIQGTNKKGNSKPSKSENDVKL
jgi:hypothetical protein